jgi:hypothetical protein
MMQRTAIRLEAAVGEQRGWLWQVHRQVRRPSQLTEPDAPFRHIRTSRCARSNQGWCTAEAALAASSIHLPIRGI